MRSPPPQPQAGLRRQRRRLDSAATVGHAAAMNLATLAVYALAAAAEIAGCFAFWAWLRLERSPA